MLQATLSVSVHLQKQKDCLTWPPWPPVSDAVILYKAVTVQGMKAYGGEKV
jgi:hypothetical protein